MAANTPTDDPHSKLAWLTPAARALPPTRDAQTAGDLADLKLTHFRLLHLNESPYPPSPRAIEAVAAASNELHRYPAVRGQPLANAVAARTGIKPNRIIVGTGSGELILFLCNITLSPGDHVVIPAPTFPGYIHATRLFGGVIKRAKLDAQGANDPATLAAAVTDRTRLVFCCTPNPPSGGMMDAAAIERVAATIPDTAVLVVDEAYYEFARADGGPDILPILAKRRGPWVVLRTFSKAYGLASLRVGYAICGSDEVAEGLRRAMVPYTIANVSLAAAKASLDDDQYLDQTLQMAMRERQRLSAGLATLGLAPMPSAANFVSVKMPMQAAVASAELRKRSILVRDWRDPEYMQELRITVGLPDDTDAVLAAMKDILAAHKA